MLIGAFADGLASRQPVLGKNGYNLADHFATILHIGIKLQVESVVLSCFWRQCADCFVGFLRKALLVNSQVMPVPHAGYRFGSANATNESPDFVPSLPPPPAAMATYCRPLTEYVQGV